MAKTFNSGDLLLINRQQVTYKSDYSNLVDSIKLDLFGDGTSSNPSVIALNDLLDVEIDESAINDGTTGWVLQYNQTDDTWQLKDPKDALSGAIALNNLIDVTTVDTNFAVGAPGYDLSAVAGEGAVLAYDVSEGQYFPAKLKDVLASLPSADELVLNDLGDVDTATNGSSTNDVLVFDGTNYVPKSLKDAISGGNGDAATALELDDLVDVTGAATATKSQVLVSNGSKNFSPKSLVDLLGELETDGKAIVLNDLGDVNNVTPGEGKFLLSDASNEYNPVDFRTAILAEALKLEELTNVANPTLADKLNSSVVTMVTAPTTGTDGVTASYAVKDIGSVIDAHLAGGGVIDIKPEDLTGFTGLFLKPNPAFVADPSATKYLPDEAKTTNLTDDIILYVEANDILTTGASVPADWSEGWYYVPQTALTGGDSGVAGGVADDAGSDDAAAQAAGTVFNTGAVRIAEFRDTTISIDATGKEVIADAADVGSIPSNLKIHPTTGVLYAEIPNTLTFKSTVVVDAASAPHFGAVDGPDATSAPANPSLGDFFVYVLDAAVTTFTNTWNGGGSGMVLRNGDMIAYNGTEWVVIGTVNTDTIQQNLQDVTEVGARTDNAIHVLDSSLTQRTGTGFVAVDGPALVTKADGSAVTAVDGDLVAHVLKVGKIDFSMFDDLPTV